MKHIEWRRTGTIIFLGLLALLSMAILAFSSNSEEKFFPFFISLTSIVLMFLIVLDHIKWFDFTLGSKELKLKVETIQGEYGPIKTHSGVDRNLVDYEEMSNEEKIVHHEFMKIIDSMHNTEEDSHVYYEEVLYLFDEKDLVVQESSNLLFNKASVLALLGRMDEAERVVKDIASKFPTKPRSIADRCDVLAFIEEIKRPAKKDVPLFTEWLNRRKALATKGLKYCPNRHSLLMHLYEIAVLEGSKDAIFYLRKAIVSNEMLTISNLIKYKEREKEDRKKEDLRIHSAARRLSPELKNLIDYLIGGNNVMKVLEIIRKHARFLLLWGIMIAIASIVGGGLARSSGSLNFIPKTIEPEINPPESSSSKIDSGGINLGKSIKSNAKEGINIGNA